MNDKEQYEEVRERIAQWGFDIWKDAKSTSEDGWDDVTWDNLPEKHKEEYRKGADTLLSDPGIGVVAKDQSRPEPVWDIPSHRTFGERCMIDEALRHKREGYHRCEVAMSDFRRIVEKPE